MNVCVYTSCAPITLGCQLYQDSTGTVPATDGYYSDGTSCFHSVGGFLVTIGSCSSSTACISYTIGTSASSGKNYSYIDCDGNPQSGVIGGGGGIDIDTFCAQEGTVVHETEMTLSTNGSCEVPVQDVFCYTLEEEILNTETISCLGIPKNITHARTIITLKDADGNPVIANQDYVFDVLYNEHDCQNPPYVGGVGITVYSGSSSGGYGYVTANWVDCGQGDCEPESIQLLGMGSVPPELSGITECAGNTPCGSRHLQTVVVAANFPEVVTLTYTNQSGTTINTTWTADGSGEEVYNQFGVFECVLESTVSVNAGRIIDKIWIDAIDCCPEPSGSCKRLSVTISEADIIDSSDSTVTMTYMNCDGNPLATYPFNEGGTWLVDLCVDDNSSFAFSYVKNGSTFNSGASGALIQGPCPEPTTFYSFMRDGTQGESGFHTPYVEYIDENGNPAVFYADPVNDICGGFNAQSITNVYYCFEC